MKNSFSIRIGCEKHIHPGVPSVVLAFVCASAFAQPVVPQPAIEQFGQVIGRRVEAVTILGGDYGAAGGIYTFRGGKVANLSVAKIGGGGIVAEP